VSAYEFRLLGPLEVWRAGEQLSVGGAKPRALLAVLLLHADHVVSSDQLIDALWGEHPPTSAANALQAHVSALRRALEPNRGTSDTDALLVTRAPGYLLRLAGYELDVVRFERLLTDARAAMPIQPALATKRFREALNLWRGPALAEFIYERFASTDAARLEEMRVGALEDCLECELACGNHAGVVAELEGLVDDQPLRERLAGELMLALYRCGRQAEATMAYRCTRTALVGELGVEPGPALRGLLQRILEQDPALDPPAVSTSMPVAPGRSMGGPPNNLPIELTSFIGREQELNEVSTLLEQTRLLTLTGAGGSGKTRLALRAARQCRDGYPDGVWLVELAPLSDPALVASATVGALGIRAQAGSLVDALKRSLRDSHLLVLLDNCEHLLDACAELAHELLSTCEQLRILPPAASRSESRARLRGTCQDLSFQTSSRRDRPRSSADMQPCACSTNERVPSAPDSHLTRERRMPLPASAGDLTGFRWRSSWRQRERGRSTRTTSSPVSTTASAS
jgi:DNA-binding SARP family transcriptional activator